MMNNTLLNIIAEDGYSLEVMLSTPDVNPKKLVLFVNGSGPNTYNIMRKKQDGTFYNYHDLFASEFVSRGIAYCRYSTRGVKDGETGPFYADVDDEQYKTYLPHNSVSDIECIVKYIRNEYPKISIYLLGWSEGSIIAPLVALNEKVKVDGLLLCGYCNENLRDTFIWQQKGNVAFIYFRKLFDYDKKGYITKSDFEEDRYHVRQAISGSDSFEQIDTNGDGILTAADFAPIGEQHLSKMLSAIELGDDDWLKNNHKICLTSAWWNEHFALEPNKNVLPKINIPIHIFSGEYDAMTPQFHAQDIEKTFISLGKTNLTVHYFENHDHDLNYAVWSLAGKMPDGIKSIFETVDKLT